MSAEKKSFDAWCLVELFGHQRIVGHVTTEDIGGASFVRVDVPAGDGSTAYTRYYGSAAIYAISPITKETAVALAQKCDSAPVRPYEVPERKCLEDGYGDDDGFHDEEGDEQ